MCGGEAGEALPAALAVELLHNFTLIHDDIMDGAHTRRNKPSVFRKWDSNTAILAGDVLYAHAFEQLQPYAADERYTRAEYAGINKTFLDAVVSVCRGQAMDMEFEARDRVSPDEYLDMIHAKTGALLACSVKLGALAAHAPGHQVHSASMLGYHSGIAFQIQDDLLDAVGDAAKFGKVIGGDIREGKKTWLTITAFSKASEKQKERLAAVLKMERPPQDEVDHVIQLYHQLHVIEAAQSAVNDHYEKAQACLHQFEDSEYKNKINNLLHQLMVRES